MTTMTPNATMLPIDEKIDAEVGGRYVLKLTRVLSHVYCHSYQKHQKSGSQAQLLFALLVLNLVLNFPL